MARNGYFTFETKADGTYITIHPPVDGGKAVAAEDIITFLDLKRFNEYQPVDIKKGLDSADTNPTFRFSCGRLPSSAAFCIYEISKDLMYVVATLMPEVMGGTKMSLGEVLGDLKSKGVKFGINEEVIEEVVKNEIYNTKVIFAKGEPAVQGRDGKIEYLFNAKPVAKPKVNENGTVDYHDLDLINKVTEGQVVARINPAVKGTPGHNVMGSEIVPNKVAKVSFKYNKNLHVSEDELELISNVSGHISLEGDKVFVSNTYEVPVDVDVTTGDINYDGNILVRGNVRAGFNITATGNINILGVVEGATVTAGGDLTIGRGVQGMNKAILKSGGNIVAKFFENATIICDGDVDTDSLLHSNATVGGGVNVEGKNGLIIGGSVKSRKNIVAKQIGNDMGTTTDISVGVDPNLKKRSGELAGLIKNCNDDKTKLMQAVTVLKKKLQAEGKLDRVKMEMLQKSMQNLVSVDQKIKEYGEEYKDIQTKLSEDSEVRVKVSRSIYPGVKLTFGSESLYVKSRNDYCQYAKQGADIVMLPL